MATPTKGRAATIVIQASVAVGDRRSSRMKVAMSTTQTTCATLSRSPHDKVIEATLAWSRSGGLAPGLRSQLRSAAEGQEEADRSDIGAGDAGEGVSEQVVEAESRAEIDVAAHVADQAETERNLVRVTQVGQLAADTRQHLQRSGGPDLELELEGNEQLILVGVTMRQDHAHLRIEVERHHVGEVELAGQTDGPHDRGG